jgi:hypothetical protein
MLSFRKKPPAKIAPYLDLVKELAERDHTTGYVWNFKLKDSETGKKILALKPAEQRLYVLASLHWLDPANDRFFVRRSKNWVRLGMLELLRRRLPFEEGDLLALLDWSLDQRSNYYRGVPQIIKTLDDHFKEHELSQAVSGRIEALVAAIGDGYAESSRWQARLRDFLRRDDQQLPLEPGEAWADAAIAAFGDLDPVSKQNWFALFNHCARASGAAPGERWVKAAGDRLEAVGASAFKSLVLALFPLVAGPGARQGRPAGYPGNTAWLNPANTDLLRGLVWTCALDEDEQVARALAGLALAAYHKIPGSGPLCPKVGNACIWALGQMPGRSGLGQLPPLKLRVKFLPAQKGIANALQVAAARLNLPAGEIEELSVPTYGLTEVGFRRESFGGYTGEIAIQGGELQVLWFQADGRPQASIPKTVKQDRSEALKEFLQAGKDIRRMLPAQGARLDNAYLEAKRWKYPVWRERYLDHPLVGTLARRLIWKFSRGDRAASGIWWSGGIAGSDGRPLDWLDGETQVELWHPIFVNPEQVLSWRTWLEQNQVRQPFKQAHREIYLLTDAERETGVYSNRFAAHVIKQHQFHALCGQRGWANRLRLMVDDLCPPATRPLPAWNLRAEFWVESIGDQFAVDTTPNGAFLYLSTDQVRFYRTGASQNTVHAMGGGYSAAHRTGISEPLPLEEIPPLVLSEILRDVDLFVGVASVGNDPNWIDGGREPRYHDYWNHFSFGELSETAKTRSEILRQLVPRLKIGPRCTLSDRFLIVKGDLRTYKIHLGSGNILMEPNDQYLCIVPRSVGNSGRERIFLPFEGDQMLSVILSKAFLLAEDKQITDATIRRQIKM